MINYENIAIQTNIPLDTIIRIVERYGHTVEHNKAMKKWCLNTVALVPGTTSAFYAINDITYNSFDNNLVSCVDLLDPAFGRTFFYGDNPLPIKAKYLSFQELNSKLTPSVANLKETLTYLLMSKIC